MVGWAPLNNKWATYLGGRTMPACDCFIGGKSFGRFVAVVAAFVLAVLIPAASTQTAEAACSTVVAKVPILYNNASNIAGNAIVRDCGELTKVSVTLWWGHVTPGPRPGISIDPRKTRTIATPGKAFHAFGTGKILCWPGVYMTEVKGYDASGKVVAHHKSKKLGTRCDD